MTTLVCARTFGKLSHATFTIKPIRGFVSKYVGDGRGWIDPFAGDNSPAEFTNDWNIERHAKCHMEAEAFVLKLAANKTMRRRVRGAIFDPPYSYRQVSEHYRVVGRKATALDTSYNFYRRVMVPLSVLLQPGAVALSFGWNTNGFGKSLGFEKLEVLVVAHGGHHNDTLCLAERKL